MRLLLFILPLLVIVTKASAKCKACIKPEWQLVFKVVGGIATATETDPLIVDPYALWNRNAPYNEDVAEAQKLDTTFKGHFKSHLVSNWNLRNIQEVKVAFLDDNGKELISLIYDGRGTNKNNWFSATRLLKSPWTDIFLEPRNFCGILGHQASKRRWYINRNYGGCDTDAGWIVVGGNNVPHCSWERRFARPQFLYSKQKTYSTWWDTEHIGSASLFAIFIRTKCLYN